jgi:hypothetical protein
MHTEGIAAYTLLWGVGQRGEAASYPTIDADSTCGDERRRPTDEHLSSAVPAMGLIPSNKQVRAFVRGGIGFDRRVYKQRPGLL